MIINNICSPAIIYLGFSLTQIIIDIYKMMYNTAFLKFIVSIVFTIILNILCERGLNIISWIIVFIPFMFMTVITSILLFMFGLDPFLGKLNYDIQNFDDENNLIIEQRNPRDMQYIDNSDKILYDDNTINNIVKKENSHINDLPINKSLEGSEYSNNIQENNINRNSQSNINQNKKINTLSGDSDESFRKSNISNCFSSCFESCNKNNKSNNNYCNYSCDNMCKNIGYKTI